MPALWFSGSRLPALLFGGSRLFCTFLYLINTTLATQLDSRRWASWTRADAVLSSVSAWGFENVEVAQYEYPDCYHGAILQVGVGCTFRYHVCHARNTPTAQHTKNHTLTG